MSSTPESSFSSADCSFIDPLFDDDAFFGQSPVWNWDAPLNGSFAADHTPSFTCVDSAYAGDSNMTTAPFNEAAYAQDWSFLASAARFPLQPATTSESVTWRYLQMTPGAPSTSSPSLQDMSSPSSSQSSTDRLPRVPIQRAQPRNRHKASSKSPGSASGPRYFCANSRCGKSFGRQSDLHRHNLDVHSRSGRHYECDVATCYYSSRRNDKVKEHCQKMHQQPRGGEQFTVVVDKA